MLLLIFAAFGASATALISPRLRARPTAVANNRAAPIVPAPLASRRLATIVRASPVAEQPTVNTGLVRSMVLNQIVVGYSLWLINGSGREIFTSQAHFGPVSLAPARCVPRRASRQDSRAKASTRVAAKRPERSFFPRSASRASVTGWRWASSARCRSSPRAAL